MINVTVTICMDVNKRPKVIHTEHIPMDDMKASINQVKEVAEHVYQKFRESNQHLRTVVMRASAKLEFPVHM